MSKVKIFVDLMSQPSRAVALFVRLNNIKHDVEYVQIRKGEHIDPEYVSKVHKLGKVPAIIDENNNIIESVAILRYLSAKYPIVDHWYPKDVLKRARVDEFLEWQHIGLRLPLSMFFQTKFILPLVRGKPANPDRVEFWQTQMEIALDNIENVWLKETPFLAGDSVSAADLIGLCEIDQPRMGGYEPGDGRPKLAAWQDRVRNEIQPHYGEVTAVIEKVIKKFGGVPPSDLSKL